MYGIKGEIFRLTSPSLSNETALVLDGKFSQDYPDYPQGSIFELTLFLLYINDLPDDVICNIAICADDTSLYSKCNQTSDLWQQLEFVSEFESYLQDIVDWSRTGLLISMLEKLSWFCLTGLILVIDVKMDGSVLEEKSSFKMLALTLSSKVDCVYCITSIGKTKKVGAFIHSMEFFSREVALYLYKSVIQPCMEY